MYLWLDCLHVRQSDTTSLVNNSKNTVVTARCRRRMGRRGVRPCQREAFPQSTSPSQQKKSKTFTALLQTFVPEANKKDGPTKHLKEKTTCQRIASAVYLLRVRALVVSVWAQSRPLRTQLPRTDTTTAANSSSAAAGHSSREHPGVDHGAVELAPVALRRDEHLLVCGSVQHSASPHFLPAHSPAAALHEEHARPG